MKRRSADIPVALQGEATSSGYEIVSSTTPGFYTFMFIGDMYDASRLDGYGRIKEDFVVAESSLMRINKMREAINPNTVASYVTRHLHMGPSRHHEYTVPVYR